MLDTPILSAQRTFPNYFDTLAQARPLATSVAAQLQPFTAAGADALRRCGRFPVGSGQIELFQRAQGGLYVRGVKWCASRYCPICQPRIMRALGWQRGQRAKAAQAAGYGVGLLTVGVPSCAPGELRASLELLHSTFREVFPSPSRLPVAWARAGLPDYLGADWNTELDWCSDTGRWYPHLHAVIFREDGPWTPEALAFVKLRWPWPGGLSDAQAAHSPEAVARYSVKAENRKPHALSLFDLTRLGEDDLVAELLGAVQGIRLRAASLKLSALLRLDADPSDEELLTEPDSDQGLPVQRLTLGEWCRLW